MKPIGHLEARRLRGEEGASVSEIAARLGVSRSTASRWVRDVVLRADQIEALAQRNRSADATRRGHACAAGTGAPRDWQREGRERARRGDPLHLAGCMLYWAEGTKDRNSATLVNSDAELLRMFGRFLRESYAVHDGALRFSCNCHLGNGPTLEEIEAWWLERLELPRSTLRASTVDRPSSASRWRRNTLPYGTGRLAVHSTAIVQSIYGAIQEYAGIERPEWLG